MPHGESVSHNSLKGTLLRTSVLLRLLLMLPSVTSNKSSLFLHCFSEAFPIKPATWALSALLLNYLFFSQEHAKKMIQFLFLHFSLQKLPHFPRLGQNFRVLSCQSFFYRCFCVCSGHKTHCKWPWWENKLCRLGFPF